MSVLGLERVDFPYWASRFPLQAEGGREIQLVCRRGDQLSLPAPALLAVSRSLSSIFHSDLLLAAISPSVFLPVSMDCLEAFKEILLFGKVEGDLVAEKENVEELFYLLDIESSISITEIPRAADVTEKYSEAEDVFTVAYNADIQFLLRHDTKVGDYSPPPSPSQFLQEEESLVNAIIDEEIVSQSPSNHPQSNSEIEDAYQKQNETPGKFLQRSSKRRSILGRRLEASLLSRRSRLAATSAGQPGPCRRKLEVIKRPKTRDPEKKNKSGSKEDNLKGSTEYFHGFSQSDIRPMLDVRRKYRALLRHHHGAACLQSKSRQLRSSAGQLNSGKGNPTERDMSSKKNLQSKDVDVDSSDKFHGFSKSEVDPMLDVQRGYRSLLRRSSKSLQDIIKLQATVEPQCAAEISNHALARPKMRLSYDQKKFLSNGSKQTDGNSFKCDRCPKSFSWKSNLYNHNKQVHDGARLYCNQCNKSFVRKTALENHDKKSHPI